MNNSNKPAIIQLFFWFLSLNFWTLTITNGWYILFNPVYPNIIPPIKNLFWEEEFRYLLFMEIFMILFLLPTSWLFKKLSRTIKIIFTIIFFLAIVFLLLHNLLPESINELISITLDILTNVIYIIIFHISIVASFYINVKLLITRYLRENKILSYLLFFTGLAIITALVNYGLFDYCIDPIFPQLYFLSYYRIWELIIIVAVYLFMPALFIIVQQYIKMLIEKRQQTQNELAALKAQINPHFLFNNLNTIYSMASKNDKRTKDVVLELSDFLRYILYDTASETISLKKEIDIIQTYINLQKERVNPQITHIYFNIEGNPENAEIPPLLLLPLTENCFKHGIGKKESNIKINVGFDGKVLHFTSENSVAKRNDSRENGNGGLGIANVKKRLEMLYPNRHSLIFNENNGIFMVELTIEL